jgi:hypothetical protein
MRSSSDLCYRYPKLGRAGPGGRFAGQAEINDGFDTVALGLLQVLFG